ncbi:hypothetical protein [Rhodopseudomonas sp. B29]|uniref:hypothetical protein n=1 Tax=Rhodopseudomonas sp. B29 TaxID=95607 RepID=UPI000344BF78|nr:hypothetical protein [Rhodopseudomonas sp. B29]
MSVTIERDAELSDSDKVLGALAPVVFTVELRGSVAVALYSHAISTGAKAETVIAEAVGVYLGEEA